MKKLEVLTYSSIAVIVVSLFFIGTSLTGYASVTDLGFVNVTVISSAAINFTTGTVNFGEGAVDGGQAGASMNTEGTSSSNGNWSYSSIPLTIENIGNVNVSLGLQASANADTFLGGSDPLFQYKVSDVSGEAGSCGDAAAGVTYTNFTTSNVIVCGTFLPDDATDAVDVDINLYVPSDSNVGSLGAVVTATGTV